MTAKDNDKALKKSCASVLKHICLKYDNLEEVDKLASVTNKVEMVKNVMHENIEQALENTATIEDIEAKSGEISVPL